MRTLFLVNPSSGRGAGQRVWQRIAEAVPESEHCQILFPGNVSETRRAAKHAAADGVERLVVVGGDGTVAAVADGLAGSNTVLGVIPAGTGNDFCRNAGLPLRPRAAMQVALGASIQRIDLGRLNGGRCFVNVAGLGFDAQVARVATRYPTGLGGTLPYLMGALSTLSWYRPTLAEVTVDGHHYSGPTMLIAVANGRYYGGGMQIAPQARTDDGRLDVCVATDLDRLDLLRILRQVYSGGHVHHPKVHFFQGTRVRVAAEGPLAAHLDGEPVEPTSLEFEVSPRALSVAMPGLR